MESMAQDRQLDREKLAKLLALTTSPNPHEAASAMRKANSLRDEAGMGWEDVLAPLRQLEIATDAASILLAENTALKAELDELRTNGTAIAVWRDVGAATSNTRAAAKWALDLHRRELVYLTAEFEVPFLNTCARWTGPLRPKQRPIFQQILDRVVERTGLTPPA
jgi:hypothetical protein